MNYNLKEKIVVTEEFLNDLVTKSWQEADTLQQQITHIDTSTVLGAEIVKLLKNACTNYYILIGCLENLIENSGTCCANTVETDAMAVSATKAAEPDNKILLKAEVPADLVSTPEPTAKIANKQNATFEPFEYFVDFDEPYGEPLSDNDLYNN